MGTLIAVSLTVLFLLLAFSARRGSTAAAKRLDRLQTRDKVTEETIQEQTIRDRTMDLWRERLGNMVARIGRRQSDRDVYESVRQRLVEAGFRNPNALSIYMGSRVSLAIGLSFLSLVVSTSLGAPPSLFTLMLPAMLGYLLPGAIVDRTRRRRQENIDRGLADAIDLMVICIEAGLGLRATLDRIAVELRKREPVIANEFRAAVAEAEAGRGLLRALRSMADRAANAELNTLVSLLIQTDRFGTPVAETLRMQGDAIRFNRMQMAEEAAQKAPIKMLAPSMLIFAAILIILGGPAMIVVSNALPGAADR